LQSVALKLKIIGNLPDFYDWLTINKPYETDAPAAKTLILPFVFEAVLSI